MNDKITKLNLEGKEYFITDKQAQQIIDVISTDVEQLKKNVEYMSKTENIWKVIR